MNNHNYVMAADKDFEKQREHFYCVGKEPYIEIPHSIQGEKIIGIDWMFCGNKVIKGVKSTNENIKSMDAAFRGCYTNELDLSKFDATYVSSLSYAFDGAQIKNIIFPNTGFPQVVKATWAFASLNTNKLDLSGFNFSNSDCDGMIYELRAKRIIFPINGLVTIVKSDFSLCYCPLKHVPTNSQTEEICWAAVLGDKSQGKFVKIKNKKILMYLGAECPEYAKFYYDEEKINE